MMEPDARRTLKASPHVYPDTQAYEPNGEQGKQDRVGHMNRLLIRCAHPQFAGNQEKRKGDADVDVHPYEDVGPNEADAVLASLEHHEYRCGDEEEQDVAGDGPRRGRHFNT